MYNRMMHKRQRLRRGFVHLAATTWSPHYSLSSLSRDDDKPQACFLCLVDLPKTVWKSGQAEKEILVVLLCTGRPSLELYPIAALLLYFTCKWALYSVCTCGCRWVHLCILYSIAVLVIMLWCLKSVLFALMEVLALG